MSVFDSKIVNFVPKGGESESDRKRRGGSRQARVSRVRQRRAKERKAWGAVRRRPQTLWTPRPRTARKNQRYLRKRRVSTGSTHFYTIEFY